MRYDSIDTETIELTNELPLFHGVHFSLENTSLTGNYSDELSLFRAKKCWTQILEDNFLLEPHYDYSFSYESQLDNGSFSLTCNFLTACGRYAFWRLTNNQAPEAQYLIETAHIPNAELRQIEFAHSPDLFDEDELYNEPIGETMPLSDSRTIWLRTILSSLRQFVSRLR